jgi:hypothetical protein
LVKTSKKLYTANIVLGLDDAEVYIYGI